MSEARKQVYKQTDLLLYCYRFRYGLAALFATACFLGFSALVTALGAHSVLDTTTGQKVEAIEAPAAYTSNAVTASTYEMANSLKQGSLKAGVAVYSTSRSITKTTTKTSRATVHVSTTIVGGAWNSLAFVENGIGSITSSMIHTVGSTMLTGIRTPGNIVSSITSHDVVSAAIRPADDAQVPTINSETSAAILEKLTITQRQQIASLQAAQVTANRDLAGTIVVGSQDHGGYPAKWDNRAQDSTLDSWGMYNRECVSYTAWKVYQTYGQMPYWGGVGNANQWVRDARNAGIPTSSIPKVHSVAISMHGYYGHAMWVEAVRGNMIYVSQYNYDLRGHYSEMWVNGDYFTYIYFK